MLDGKNVVKPPQPPREETRERKKPNNRPGNQQTQEQKRPHLELELRPLRPRIGKYNNYHELTMNVEEVFARSRDRVPFKKPAPIKKEATKRDQNQYCRYYQEVGHDTIKCFDLKNKIETLIQQGYLQEFRAVQRRGRKQDNTDRRGNPQKREPV